MAEEKSALEFYPLDLDSDSKGVVSLFGRTAEGRRVIVRDSSFRFYFYVLGKQLEKLQKRLEFISLENESFQVLKTELCQKRFLDKPVEALKVFVNQPAAVRAIQQEYGDIEVKEADISLGKKYLIEKQIVPLGLCRAEGYLQKKKGVFIVEQARVESVEGGELDQV